MSLKRINAVPPPAFPPHAVPLYGLPVGNILYETRKLDILRGGVTLAIPANVVAGNDIDFRDDITKNDRLGFRFTVKNSSSNPNATITNFSVENNIELFEAFNSSDDPSGDIITSGSDFDLVFFTTFGIGDLNQGINTLTGAWNLGNTFAGFNDLEEEYVIQITYRVIIPYVNDNSKKSQFGPGKTTPDVYFDEYIILNNRERQSFDRGIKKDPG